MILEFFKIENFLETFEKKIHEKIDLTFGIKN